jgi:hypothetical protein
MKIEKSKISKFKIEITVLSYFQWNRFSDNCMHLFTGYLESATL